MKTAKAFCCALVTAFAFAAFVLPATASAAPSGNDPIVMVHGFTGNNASWNYFISRLVPDGYTNDDFALVSYTPQESNIAIAEKVKDAVEDLKASSGKSKVDIFTHSMGALGSRYYIKFLGGASSVDEWVSMGGPNHGTVLAPICTVLYLVPCVQMTPLSPFLTKLNWGDETPGGVRYLTMTSLCDEIVVPSPTTTPLIGATNRQVGCVEHTQINKVAVSYDMVMNFVD